VSRHAPVGVPARCRHCNCWHHLTGNNSKRGLCWQCYRRPGVRFAYGRLTNRGTGLRGKGNLPREPTSHPPGSPEKLLVMAERACRGTCLFHPLDCTH
jgi:hypothetical protein